MTAEMGAILNIITHIISGFSRTCCCGCIECLSRRQVAERFSVSSASACAGVLLPPDRVAESASHTGSGTQAGRIQTLIAEKGNLTLTEIRAQLVEDDHHCAIGTL